MNMGKKSQLKVYNCDISLVTENFKNKGSYSPLILVSLEMSYCIKCSVPLHFHVQMEVCSLSVALI